MTRTAFRPHRADHRADQLIGQLALTAIADHARGNSSVHVTTRGLAIDTSPLGDRAQPELATEPMTQNLRTSCTRTSRNATRDLQIERPELIADNRPRPPRQARR
jgi:hypothetical protein